MKEIIVLQYDFPHMTTVLFEQQALNKGIRENNYTTDYRFFDKYCVAKWRVKLKWVPQTLHMQVTAPPMKAYINGVEVTSLFMQVKPWSIVNIVRESFFNKSDN